MDDLYRALFLLKFVAFMAMVYLGLHILVARVSRAPDSKLVWFFSVVTGPLTRPVRALVPPGTAEPRVRSLTFAAIFVFWLAVTILAAVLRAKAR